MDWFKFIYYMVLVTIFLAIFISYLNSSKALAIRSLSENTISDNEAESIALIQIDARDDETILR